MDKLSDLQNYGIENRFLKERNPYEKFSIRHEIIRFTAFNETIRKIAQLHNRGRAAGISTGLLITGQSGSGKSTVLDHYCSHFPHRDEPERTVRPVLRVDTPSKPTVKNLAEAILGALGDTLINKGSTEEKTQRIYRYLIECRVELLVIDEFQHFHDTRRRSEARQVTDWLKNVINHAQIPVVVVGLPRSSLVIRMNEQLARRFSSGFYLRPFGFDTEEQRREFRAILKNIHSRLPLKCPPLHEANLAHRFYVASNGLIDYVAKIIDEAVLQTGNHGWPELTMETMALAFEESIWRGAPPLLNPFHPESILRQLDQMGEPFELWDDPEKYKKDRSITQFRNLS